MENSKKAWIVRDEVEVDRKPFSPDEVRSQTDFNDLSQEVKNILQSLPIIDSSVFSGSSGLFTDALNGDQQIYMMKHKEDFYFIDNQGYEYARYVGKVLNFPNPEFEDLYIKLKEEVMDELGYTEEDMEEEDIEDEVNRETDERFFEITGFEFSEIE